MASLPPSVICWFLLLFAWRCDGQNCPQIGSIFPPSGTTGVIFTISGSNLNQVSRVVVGNNAAIETITTFSQNSTHLQFAKDDAVVETGVVPVVLTATNCSRAVNTTINLRAGELFTIPMIAAYVCTCYDSHSIDC